MRTQVLSTRQQRLRRKPSHTPKSHLVLKELAFLEALVDPSGRKQCSREIRVSHHRHRFGRVEASPSRTALGVNGISCLHLVKPPPTGNTLCECMCMAPKQLPHSARFLYARDSIALLLTSAKDVNPHIHVASPISSQRMRAIQLFSVPAVVEKDSWSTSTVSFSLCYARVILAALCTSELLLGAYKRTMPYLH